MLIKTRFHEIFFIVVAFHNVEITEIIPRSHSFDKKFREIKGFTKEVDFTKYFFGEREFLVFPQYSHV